MEEGDRDGRLFGGERSTALALSLRCGVHGFSSPIAAWPVVFSNRGSLAVWVDDEVIGCSLAEGEWQDESDPMDEGPASELSTGSGILLKRPRRRRRCVEGE